MSNIQKNNKPNVPNLRFPEFSGEWKKSILKAECEINPKTGPLADTFQYIDLESVVKGQLIKVNYLKKEDAPSRAQRVLSKWDILYQCVRPYQLNNFLVRDNSSTQRVASTGYAQIRTNNNPDFFFQLLHTQKFTGRVINRCTGTNYPAINSTDLSEIEINIPEIKEQEKIGRMLSLIDQRIAIQNRLIEQYESLIKAIIDKWVKVLLSGKTVRFDQLYERAGEGGTPSTSVKEYYDGGEIPFVKIEDLSPMYLTENKDYITAEGLSKSSAWMIPEHSVIYSNGATIGSISINTYPVTTKQGILGIVPLKGVQTEYLYYMMRSSYFSKEVHRIITEGTMKTAYLKDINSIICPIPFPEIQSRMVSGLLALSEKVSLEGKIQRFLKDLKSTLLNQLFI